MMSCSTKIESGFCVVVESYRRVSASVMEEGGWVEISSFLGAGANGQEQPPVCQLKTMRNAISSLDESI